jgi:hypothetical protein
MTQMFTTEDTEDTEGGRERLFTTTGATIVTVCGLA